jgi:hypothetical protein
MNPSTLSFYLPLMLGPNMNRLDPSSIRDIVSTDKTFDQTVVPAPPLSALSWSSLDAQFRRSLPDEWYGKRLVYRGLVMAACGGLRMLDGVEVGEGERRKAGELIRAAEALRGGK